MIKSFLGGYLSHNPFKISSYQVIETSEQHLYQQLLLLAIFVFVIVIVIVCNLVSVERVIETSFATPFDSSCSFLLDLSLSLSFSRCQWNICR